MEQEEKDNKETKKLVIFAIIIIVLCAIIMVTSILHPIKNSNTKKQEDKTEIKDEVKPEKTEEVTKKGKEIPFDTASYTMDPRLEDFKLDLAVQISSKNFEKNLLDDDLIRITLLNARVIRNKETKMTSDTTRQQSPYISKELYEQRFKELYGNNYDYEKTVTDVEKGMQFSSCEYFEPENDGTNYCILPAASAVNYDIYLYKNINEEVINSEKIITGEYYVKETNTTYKLHGKLEIKYTIEGENQYLKSIILNNQEDYT